MFRKKAKGTWWENTNEEQNAALETPAKAAETATIGQLAADKPQSKQTKKPKRKRRWDWWDAAGDLLEIVIDFIGDLFD